MSTTGHTSSKHLPLTGKKKKLRQSFLKINFFLGRNKTETQAIFGLKIIICCTRELGAPTVRKVSAAGQDYSTRGIAWLIVLASSGLGGFNVKKVKCYVYGRLIISPWVVE